MIRRFESRAPFTCPLSVEAGQGGADQHEEQARCAADCNLRLRAQLAFNFLFNPVLPPTTNRRISTPQPRQLNILQAVAAFNAFDEANDPYGEHDFGALEIEGERLFWKSDYYDRDHSAHLPNPADPSVTTRVLTIMLAEEY